MLVSTIARGGGPLAIGVLLGVLFVAAGAGRIYVNRGSRAARRGSAERSVLGTRRSGSRRSSRSSTRRSPARSTSRSASSPTTRSGLTPVVFLAGRALLRAGGTTYVEGASLHQDRGGATVFARYAFNELVSFIAGWVILLDYIILIAVTSFSATNYLAAFWAPLGHGHRRAAAVLRDHRLRRDPQHPRLLQDARQPDRRAGRRRPRPAGARHRPRAGRLLPPRHDHRHDRPRRHADVGRRGLRARRGDRESSRGSSRPSGLSGEVAVGRRGLKRLVGAAAVDRHGRLRGHRDRRVTALPVVGNATVARAQLPRRADDRHRRGLPHRLAGERAEVHDRGRGGRDADRRVELGDARACRGWPTRCRPTARSPARWAACTRRARRPSSSSPSPRCSRPG